MEKEEKRYSLNESGPRWVLSILAVKSFSPNLRKAIIEVTTMLADINKVERESIVKEEEK